ncbi:MAG: methyl-accepting chemotaxis protein, partial [Bacteroidota bacterium]|nr:methyl-accepting chemotaxis protein [Bacteroidota bacterium]
LILIRLIFKESLMARIGYAMVVLAIIITIITFSFNYFDIPDPVSIPIRFGVIVLAILYTRADIKKLQHLSDKIEELSKFDLTIEIDNKNFKRKDEIGKLSNSIKYMITELNKIILTINNSSEDLYSASSTVDSVSQQLSQGANEQAATTEQIASSMEEIASTIDSNTKQAKETGEFAVKTSEEMGKSKTILLKSVEAVSEISDKIAIIAEIAEKTDLLSINASIEAAHAGEVGKGFAVVANEIRKLSDKTKNASEEIGQLSTSGKEISDTAAQILTKLLPKIQQSNEFISNIVEASVEQQNSTQTINSSIQQLSEVTNTNSASAEQLASSSQELAAQSEELNNIISIFKIKDETPTIKTKPDAENKKSEQDPEGYKIDMDKNSKSDDDFETY